MPPCCSLPAKSWIRSARRSGAAGEDFAVETEAAGDDGCESSVGVKVFAPCEVDEIIHEQPERIANLYDPISGGERQRVVRTDAAVHAATVDLEPRRPRLVRGLLQVQRHRHRLPAG